MIYAIILIVLTGYLLGNLNGAVCMSQLVAHEDVRKKGSGNAGLTNFIRLYGAGRGLAVILIDGGKSALACLVGGLLLQPYGMYMEGMTIGALSVMVGHDFPALLGFRGGKGILSAGVIGLIIDWRIGAIGLGVFLLVYLLSGYVSLGSVLGSVTFGALFVVFHYDNPVVMICGIVMSALALFMHRSNIVRLLRGQERKTNLFGRGEKR